MRALRGWKRESAARLPPARAFVPAWEVPRAAGCAGQGSPGTTTLFLGQDEEGACPASPRGEDEEGCREAGGACVRSGGFPRPSRGTYADLRAVVIQVPLGQELHLQGKERRRGSPAPAPLRGSPWSGAPRLPPAGRAGESRRPVSEASSPRALLPSVEERGGGGASPDGAATHPTRVGGFSGRLNAESSAEVVAKEEGRSVPGREREWEWARTPPSRSEG